MSDHPEWHSPYRVELIALIAWIAQTLFQLVLLPIIIVGQNVQAAAADARAEATFKDAEALLAEALEIQKHLSEQDQLLATALAMIKRPARLPPNA